MAKDRDNSVVAPLVGSGILGAGAYGSSLVDSTMRDIGIRSGLTLNPKAVKYIKEFANATQSDMKHPEDFIFRYSDLGNRASRVKLFNEDPRSAYEWFENEGIQRATHNNLKRVRKVVDKTRDKAFAFAEKYIKPRLSADKYDKFIAATIDNPRLMGADTDLRNAADMFVPFSSKINRAKNKNTKAFVLAHEREIGKSRPRALVRLMTEAASLDGLSPRELIKGTAEALNYRNYYNPDTNKRLRSAAEYMSYRYGIPKEQLYGYIRHFRGLDAANLSKKELQNEVGRILFPNYDMSKGLPTGRYSRNPILKELTSALGKSTKYEYNKDLGRLVETVPARFSKGITDVESVRKAINKSAILSWLKGSISRGYTGKEFGTMLSALRVGQALRNPKLRLALGLVSAGLGGLGVFNIGRNKERNTSILDKIKAKFG